jgi:hypothetical protein
MLLSLFPCLPKFIHNQRSVDKKWSDESGVPFCYRWLAQFLANHRFSLNKPHIKRRSEPDDEVVSEFMAAMDWIMGSLPLGRIFNADETYWMVIDVSWTEIVQKTNLSEICMILRHTFSHNFHIKLSKSGSPHFFYNFRWQHSLRCATSSNGFTFSAWRAGYALKSPYRPAWRETQTKEKHKPMNSILYMPFF